MGCKEAWNPLALSNTSALNMKGFLNEYLFKISHLGRFP